MYPDNSILLKTSNWASDQDDELQKILLNDP